MRRMLLASLCLIAFIPAEATSVEVPSARDTTLIEDPDGALGNGAGPAVFAGRTNAATDGVRRGLLYFDLSSALAKPGPVVSLEVDKVAVVLSNITESNVTPREYRLHRVLADWGEGISSSSGGTGAPAVRSSVRQLLARRSWPQLSKNARASRAQATGSPHPSASAASATNRRPSWRYHANPSSMASASARFHRWEAFAQSPSCDPRCPKPRGLPGWGAERRLRVIASASS